MMAPLSAAVAGAIAALLLANSAPAQASTPGEQGCMHYTPNKIDYADANVSVAFQIRNETACCAL